MLKKENLFTLFAAGLFVINLSAEQKPLMQSPYAGIDWKNVKHIPSVSHYHCRKQAQLDSGYSGGIRHFAISNYYPSAPCSARERAGQYFVSQDHAVLHNGKFTSGTLSWNEIIMHPQTGWVKELPENLRKRLPFAVKGLCFPRLPEDAIISPNAEHHSFLDISARIHINSLGSGFASGHFDAGGKYKLPEHGYPLGVNLAWQEAFQKMLDQLIFEDGGGIIINHPRWSNLKHEMICEMLDFDKQRVLGIEVWNHTAERIKRGWSREEWDAVLATGRRCFGFFVSDHEHNVMDRKTPWLGRNILLVDNMSEAECLRAYRQGRFYGALNGSGLRFESLMVNNGVFSVKTNNAATIKFIGRNGVLKTVNDNIAEIPVPDLDTGENSAYLRVEASDSSGEIIFSQPIMIRAKQQEN